MSTAETKYEIVSWGGSLRVDHQLSIRVAQRALLRIPTEADLARITTCQSSSLYVGPLQSSVKEEGRHRLGRGIAASWLLRRCSSSFVHDIQ